MTEDILTHELQREYNARNFKDASRIMYQLLKLHIPNANPIHQSQFESLLEEMHQKGIVLLSDDKTRAILAVAVDEVRGLMDRSGDEREN